VKKNTGFGIFRTCWGIGQTLLTSGAAVKLCLWTE